MSLNEKGFAPLLLLVASLGVIIFLVVAGYGPFKDSLYSVLYRKTPTYASDSTSYINHIISSGQSLSVGSDGCPALTTTQPFNNLSITEPTNLRLIPAFRPLVEDFQICKTVTNGVRDTVEGISSAMANTISNLSTAPAYEDFAVSMHGGPGYPYEGLKKDTPNYNDGMAQIKAARNAAGALGRHYRVPAVTIVHGETDTILSTPADQYTASLGEWQRDYEKDVKAITGQFDHIPLFHTQTSSHTSYDKKTSAIPESQLKASEENTGKVIMVGPKYFMNYQEERGPTSAHMKNTSYRWLGEYYGKVIKKVLVDKEDWKALSPQRITLSGNTIIVKLNVPVGPIVIDTQNVAERPKRYPNIDKSDTKYGFEYFDNNDTPANITNVEITGPDTIKITLDKSPNPASQPRLRYAHTGINNSIPGAFGLQTETEALRALGPASARGNIRDSDNTPSLYGNKLYNWMVHFDKVIPFNPGGLVVAENGCRNNASYVELGWEDFSNLPSYSYQIIRTDASIGQQQNLPSTQNRYLGDRDLKPDNLYRYRVVVKSGANIVNSSDISLTTKLCFAPPSPVIPPVPPSPVPTVSVKKLINPDLGNPSPTFFTVKQNEIDYLTVPERKWSNSGEAFKAVQSNAPGAKMAIRLVKPGTHTLTWAVDQSDIDRIRNSGFSPSSDADFFAYTTRVEGTIPVNRLKSPNQSVYTFTTTKIETDILLSLGWTVDKADAFYVFPADHPAARITHLYKLIKQDPPYYANFYSAKTEEIHFLLLRSWRFGGVPFNGVASSAQNAVVAKRMVLNDNSNQAQIHTWAASDDDIRDFRDNRGFTEGHEQDFFVYLTQKAGTIPVTRLKYISSAYNKTFYRFAVDPAQINSLTTQGWQVDKTNVFYVYPYVSPF